jgi:hypothetical protein
VNAESGTASGSNANQHGMVSNPGDAEARQNAMFSDDWLALLEYSPEPGETCSNQNLL